MDDPFLILDIDSEEQTESVAARLAPILRPGDVLLLSGQIGAGKSFLARSIIRTLLGPHTEVPSPTYTLVQTYGGPDFEIWHADLYRITDPGEVVELGLVDAFETALCLVEWPEVLGSDSPEGALDLHLEAGTTGRTMQLSGPDCWKERIRGAGLGDCIDRKPATTPGDPLELMEGKCLGR